MGRIQIKKFSLCLALTLLMPGLSAIFSQQAHSEVVQAHGEFVLKDTFTVWKMADEGDFIKIVFGEKSAYFYLHKNSESFSSNMKAIQDSLNYGTSVFVEIDTGSHEILNAGPKNSQPF
jgi:hypothetical protein